jgi:hypothetical protein
MNTITAKELRALMNLPGEPCLSFYQPTEPGGAEKDPIMFKNLITDAEEKLLAKGMSADAVKKLLRPAQALLKDPAFWKNGAQGLAFFLTPEENRCYRLRKAFGPSVMVGPHFFVKPLLALIEPEDRFYVLSLNQKRIRLWEGDANGLNEIELKTMPTSLAEALRFHDRDEPLEYHTAKVGGHWSAVFHGQGVGIDTVKDDLRLYFQKIDRGLHEYLPAKAPLILAGVEYLWPIYRKANHHPHLHERGIAGNTEQWSPRELHEKAWNLVRDTFEKPLYKVRNQYAALSGTGRTCKEPAETIRAACEGRLETLFVALDREAWGHWNSAANEVTVHPNAMNGDEDLFNLAAINASAHGAKVFVMPAREMPESNAIAGIYWLPAAKHA